MARQLGDLAPLIQEGNWGPMRTWLGQEIHGWGSELLPRELVRQACSGRSAPGLSAQGFLRYLETKFA